MTDHTKDIREILVDLFRSPIFDEADYDEMIADFMKRTGSSYASMSEQIEEGIKNGYPLEIQKKLIKMVLISSGECLSI